jgi:hypothetical protein
MASISNGIKEYIEHCKTLVNVDVFLDENDNLFVNGTLILQELTSEAIVDLKSIWLESGMTEQEFYRFFEGFILREIKLFLNPTKEKNGNLPNV